ncbi:uncharacterized protein LOC111048220, partial [Nilaparvata lugens]|uniref:uncharacterized protein LOC111048220 n=1 Tax=Nilaparvata lugens TaxID=108931 RepID=UPI00193CE92C
MSDNSLQKRSSFRTRSKARYRRTSRDLSVGEGGTEMGKPKTDGVTKERKGKRERWLLTRKTWRYMADAGRKLIPDGALNRADDVPKIEAYFQEVCHREPRFLLWRKQSYPGALGFRARGRSRGGRRKKGGSCRDKTSSADEADDLRQQQEKEAKTSTDDPSFKKLVTRPSLLQLKQEFLFGRKESPPETTSPKDALIENVLCHFDDGTSSKALDHQELLDRLTAHLASIELKESQQSRSDSYSVDTTQKQLIETMRRYYSKSTNRDKVISDILTDRKLLHKMYFELRRARGGCHIKGFDGGDGRGILKSRSRTGMNLSGAGPSGWSGSGAFRRAFNPSLSNFPGSSGWKYSEFDEGDEENDEASPWSSPPQSDTPLSGDMDYGTQTDPITEQMMAGIDEEVRRQEEAQRVAQQKEAAQKSGGGSGSGGRRSSLNHDDVSQSVSDTIKRYLRMARKKSMDSDKADRFKRINYDQTLRDIKAKPEDPISKDEDQDKGVQTDLSWVSAIKSLKLVYVEEDAPSEVSSPPPATKSLLSSGQMFLSNLLHGLQHSSSSCSVVAAAAGSMQKSKSSSSVVQQGTRLVARKVWKGRSKSQTRATPAATSTWTPQ